MFEKTCRCGSSKKNFRLDIGPFFVDECCIKAGYDALGDKTEGLKEETLTPAEIEKAESLEVKDTPELDQIPDFSEGRLITDPDELQKIEDLEIIKATNVVQDLDGNVLSQKDVTNERKAEQVEKKKRSYNKNGNVKPKNT